jgi:hypothetical protein
MNKVLSLVAVSFLASCLVNCSNPASTTTVVPGSAYTDPAMAGTWAECDSVGGPYTRDIPGYVIDTITIGYNSFIKKTSSTPIPTFAGDLRVEAGKIFEEQASDASYKTYYYDYKIVGSVLYLGGYLNASATSNPNALSITTAVEFFKKVP